jgi:pimeloyl-ACP methyl ester carboxylesterase
LPFTERTLDVRGLETLVRIGGAGPDLVYLHSAGNEGWPPALELLSERHRVIAPVAPGFPGSAGLETIDHVSDVVFHTLDVFEALGLDRPAILGMSLGGWIAAEIAARYPKEVSKLVLVDAAGLWIDERPPGEIFGVTPPELAEVLFHDQSHPAAQMMKMMVFGFDKNSRPVAGEVPPDEFLLPMIQSIEAAARIAWNPYLHDPKLPRLLGRVKAPTLVVWGKNDGLIDPAYAERYRGLIAGSVVKYIDQCGHMPAIEKPEELAAITAEFLAR